MLLTIGTSSRHGDRVSKLHQESVGLNFRQVEKKKVFFTQLTERRSSFTFLRSKWIGEASKRILPDFKAAVEFKRNEFLGRYVLGGTVDTYSSELHCKKS